jgi:hypothetical protein
LKLDEACAMTTSEATTTFGAHPRSAKSRPFRGTVDPSHLGQIPPETLTRTTSLGQNIICVTNGHWRARRKWFETLGC